MNARDMIVGFCLIADQCLASMVSNLNLVFSSTMLCQLFVVMSGICLMNLFQFQTVL